jgi:hypothetical protein
MRCSLAHGLPRDAHVFFIISKSIAPGKYIPVFKSETKPLDLSINAFKWDRSRILTQVLCKGEDDRYIKIEFYNFNSQGYHKFLGEAVLTLDQVKNHMN